MDLVTHKNLWEVRIGFASDYTEDQVYAVLENYLPALVESIEVMR